MFLGIYFTDQEKSIFKLAVKAFKIAIAQIITAPFVFIEIILFLAAYFFTYAETKIEKITYRFSDKLNGWIDE